MTRTVLDLFSGLGGFSAAFAGSDDWNVTTVDIEERFDPDIQADVLDLRPGDLPDVDVVLAGHPCTFFTFIRGATKGGDDAWTDDDPASEECREHVAMAFHTLGLIHALSPDFWFVENPRGRLRSILPYPRKTVWYCQYGSEYAKPTDLFGQHPWTFDYRRCHYGNEHCNHVKTKAYRNDGGGSDGTQGVLQKNDPAERAKVPYELSEAIREAVDEAYRNPPPEQITLGAAGGGVS